MTNDLDSLRAKAETAHIQIEKHQEIDPGTSLEGLSGSMTEWVEAHKAFRQAANPQVVISLIDQLEELQSENEKLKGKLKTAIQVLESLRGTGSIYDGEITDWLDALTEENTENRKVDK